MDHKTSAEAAVALLLICTLSIRLRSVEGNNNGKDHLLLGRQDQPPKQQQIAEPPSTIIDTAKTLFSLPNSRLALLQAAASSYWIKLKTLLFKHGQVHLSPAPTLDFTVYNGLVEASADGAGEKLKEAIVKSLDKSMVAIEDSARSAAKFAGDAMEKTAKKVKKTLSDTSAQSEAELRGRPSSSRKKKGPLATY